MILAQIDQVKYENANQQMSIDGMSELVSE